MAALDRFGGRSGAFGIEHGFRLGQNRTAEPLAGGRVPVAALIY